ncbi:effector-associated domain EAD1-containing protein [Frankia sp. Cas3]|uniref:effector-associated domain EAD1-containing protein n=1 Tax=Frankia sp. Cas3 TaxID=3073926 RepID=UPI002AD491A5|nr:effector-associated domain EAD1-containing protein [Frankia sp. Cas3]
MDIVSGLVVLAVMPAAAGSSSGSAGSGDTLLYLGVLVMVTALSVFGSALTLVPWVSMRPRGTRRWATRRAVSRVEPVATALSRSGTVFPAAELIAADARRRRLVWRTLFLLMPVFILSSIGLALGSLGLMLGAKPWRIGATTVTPELWLPIGMIVLVGGFFTELALVLQTQKWMYNRSADLFAVHGLLRAVELALQVQKDPTLDMVMVRRETAAQLGAAARDLDRLIRRILPLGVRGEERADIARHAGELARSVRQHQVTVVSGSRAQLVGLAPMIGATLAALVEDRFTDLPRTPKPKNPVPSIVCGPQDDIKLSEDDRQEFILALSRVFTSDSSADLVLAKIGYERQRRRSIDNSPPEQVWNEIFVDLENGVVVAPYRRLLQVVLRRNRGNSTFCSLAERYGMLPE